MAKGQTAPGLRLVCAALQVRLAYVLQRRANCSGTGAGLVAAGVAAAPLRLKNPELKVKHQILISEMELVAW